MRGRGAANAQGSLKNARERKLDTIVRQFKGELHVHKKKKRLAPGVALKQDEMLFALGSFKLVRVVVFFRCSARYWRGGKRVIKLPPELTAHQCQGQAACATCSRCHGESSKDLTQFMNFVFPFWQSKIFDFVLPPTTL